MAWDEAATWLEGDANEHFYQSTLDDAAARPGRDAKKRKVIRPHEMPWELSRQGILKHLLNESMDTRMETVDMYMQVIPPGSRSGRHRHLAEECLYVLEGRGYDEHQDCEVEITDDFHWRPQERVQRFEWEAGDVIYIPPNTIHRHCNADTTRPARLISATNRIFKHCGLNDLEQLDDAPEFTPGVALTAASVRELLRVPARSGEESLSSG